MASSASWSYLLPPQLGLMGQWQLRPAALLPAVNPFAWGALRATPFGPQMAQPNLIVGGAAAEVPSEGLRQRLRLRSLGVGGTGPTGILRVDQVVHVLPLVPFAPSSEQPCLCTAHGAGGAAGTVCLRHCGCYGPTHMCLTCATISSLTGGGGVCVIAIPRPARRCQQLAAFSPVPPLPALPLLLLPPARPQPRPGPRSGRKGRGTR